MERDRYGYVKGYGWHLICAEHNDALCAWNNGQQYEEGGRIDQAEEALTKLRRQLEDRIRKDVNFLYEVAALTT